MHILICKVRIVINDHPWLDHELLKLRKNKHRSIASNSDGPGDFIRFSKTCRAPTQPETPQTWRSCGFCRAWCKLSTNCIRPVDFVKSVNIRLAATWYCKLVSSWWNNLHRACMQFASCSESSCLTTCNRLGIIKPEQAMRTDPDIGLVIADFLQLARFWLCKIMIKQKKKLYDLKLSSQHAQTKKVPGLKTTTNQNVTDLPVS